MKWEKLAAAAMAAVMTAAFVTGCGGQQQNKQTDNASKDKIVIGLDDNFPPFGFHDESGELVGFDIDMAKEAGKRLGMTVEFKPIDWDSKETELKSKKIDAIWNGLSITPEREKNILFSRPYENGPQILLVLDNSPIQSKADLAGKVVGTQQGSTGLEAIQSEPEVMNSFKELKQYSDNVTSFMDLEVGRIDAVVVAKTSAGYFMKKNGAKFRIIDVGYPDIPSGVGMRKDDTELKAKLDKVLEDMHNDGTSTKLSEKWFGIDVSM
ncbi:MAG: amino acid ABC transporter substrate-binding protein [Megasphaera sp.]|jgi:polar amino acid transport system substrate-binding protein|nr:amino acid ABC transporter substrate-binding protein [Megasphaera sp.]MCH4188161.1 amino acid ABC transporter substrate-binding protein [Megasphaera sp.]MCH4217937.1 amino acid ABC transporter substrate-binding protein [Megasphaera sp.]